MGDMQQTIGVFDLFTIGIGPSSSHTVGPMKAAADFAERLTQSGAAPRVRALRVDVLGSLAATGAGHGTFTAILLGLAGARPDQILPEQAEVLLDRITRTGTVEIDGRYPVPCRVEDFVLRPLTVHPRHTNALSITATDEGGHELAAQTYFSVGGGFVVREGDEAGEEVGQATGQEAADGSVGAAALAVPLPFRTGAELLEVCDATGRTVSEVMRAHERARRSDAEISQGLQHIWEVMEACVRSSVARVGLLPGGLGVRRRAGEWAARLEREDPHHDEAFWQQRVNLVALAVNEENASGGRIVTAPTNGAAGIVPAVLSYALDRTPAGRADRAGSVERFLLAAAAIGTLYKANASISGAEVGCQGEVGSASSMAAAGLAEVLDGTPGQVENAAEIAMEHNLGLTCDPIGGLVQIPCIERNAIAAAQAVNAAHMALWGDGDHRVSLDQVIATMRETGADMSHKYKETALGGLAVNVVEC